MRTKNKLQISQAMSRTSVRGALPFGGVSHVLLSILHEFDHLIVDMEA